MELAHACSREYSCGGSLAGRHIVWRCIDPDAPPTRYALDDVNSGQDDVYYT